MLSEAQFLEKVLIDQGLVDEPTIVAIRRQFRSSVVKASGFAADEAHYLDAHGLFLMLQSRGDAGDDFAAWEAEHWLPRVNSHLAARTEQQSRAARRPAL